MIDLGAQLRAADPLTFEAGPSAMSRARVRAAVLGAALTTTPPSRRPSMSPRRRTVALAALGFLAIAMSIQWRFGAAPAYAAVRFEVRLAEAEPRPGLREAPVGVLPRVVYIHDDVVVTNDDISDARVVASASEAVGVEIRLTPAGSARLRVATRGHLGRPVALMVDGVVVAAPTVRSEIGDVGLLSGTFTRADAERIVRGILPR